MTVAGLLLIATLIMKFWPETGSAQWLRRTLVERPLELLSSVRREHIIFLIIGFAVMYSFAEAGMPHLAFAAAVDFSAYVDAVLVLWTVAALNRSRGAWAATMAKLPKLGRPAARPRRRRRQRDAMAMRSGANDDEHPGRFALAA